MCAGVYCSPHQFLLSILTRTYCTKPQHSIHNGAKQLSLLNNLDRPFDFHSVACCRRRLLGKKRRRREFHLPIVMFVSLTAISCVCVHVWTSLLFLLQIGMACIAAVRNNSGMHQRHSKSDGEIDYLAERLWQSHC